MTLGAIPHTAGTRFAVHSAEAEAVWLCLFDGERETRLAVPREGDGRFAIDVAGMRPGQRYGLRADGPWAPEQGLRFDPDKLLVDPYATRLDRRFAYDPRLALWRGQGGDTAPLVPKAIVESPRDTVPPPPLFRPGGLIYELNVRGFTLRHPQVPPHQRGTIAALAHPAVVAHLQRLHVAAIELMPVVAWIDERHLPPLGLSNAWGYNPVVLMALDPLIAPGGADELAATVAALRAAGIGVILDLVFNHSGESDVAGPTLSLRGLDNRTYYAHASDDPALLVNDTGTGNTLACWQPAVRELILASLRHFAALGVDGFRFDLATILARTPEGIDLPGPLYGAIAADPILSTRILVAEPWDIGPGGYRLGGFPASMLEWNDRYRDDVRRFWRGGGRAAAFSTRLCGSSDIFAGERTRSVNFLAAHDGFALADLVAYEERHNLSNGEDNRDGHGENLSWNNGTEGPSDDPAVRAARDVDLRALLATLFASRGTIMLTAGDEFGRTQQGNNNAYAQDNAITWLDWHGRDVALEAFVAALADIRAAHPEIGDPTFLHPADAEWFGLDGTPMTPERWDDPATAGFELRLCGAAIRIDRRARRCDLKPL